MAPEDRSRTGKEEIRTRDNFFFLVIHFNSQVLSLLFITILAYKFKALEYSQKVNDLFSIGLDLLPVQFLPTFKLSTA